MIGPDLRIVYVVVLIGEMVVNDVVDFFLDKRTDVVEDCLFLLAHTY